MFSFESGQLRHCRFSSWFAMNVLRIGSKYGALNINIPIDGLL